MNKSMMFRVHNEFCFVIGLKQNTRINVCLELKYFNKIEYKCLVNRLLSHTMIWCHQTFKRTSTEEGIYCVKIPKVRFNFSCSVYLYIHISVW